MVFDLTCATIKIYETLDKIAAINIIVKTNKYVKALKSFKITLNLVQLAAEPVARFEGGS